MKPELKRLWDGAVKAAEQRAWEYGTLGDGAGNVTVPGLADRFYVNLGKTITMARNEAALPPTAGLAVRLRNENGTYVIYGKSNAGELAAPTPAATIQAANVAAALSGAAAKVTPVDADGVPLIDSEASNGLKLLSWANLKATLKTYFDTLYGVGTAIVDAMVETTIEDGDGVPFIDLDASYALKKITWENIKATLKTYLDTLYVALTGNQTITGDKSFADHVDIGNYGPLSGSSLTSKVTIAHDYDGITGIHAHNPSAGTAADFRHLVYDNFKSSYIAFSMPGSGNTGTIFGLARNTLALLFSAGGTYLRHLAIGTFHATDLIFGTSNAERMRITSGGDVMVHNGTGGSIFVTKTGLAGSIVTIIPDGAGDVTKGITGFFVCDSGGAVMSTFQLTPGTGVNVAVGGFTLRLAVTAGGAFTAVRTGGAGTATLAIQAVWI